MGSKLDTSAAFRRNDLEDSNLDDRVTKGFKGRAIQQKNKKLYEIKSNIEGSQLWNDPSVD
jgi:hypothetical protein